MAKKKIAIESQSKVDRKAVDSVRLELLKEFGANAVVMGSDHEKAQYGRLSTGSIDLDLKLGGGLPIGRMIQIAGEKSTSKSTICDHIIKKAQETSVTWIWTERKAEKGREVVEEHPREVNGLICGYLDIEGTKTQDWTRDTIGVDTESWVYAQPSGMEECFEMAHQMQLRGVNLIVIDSIDALEPTKIYESSFEDTNQMGLKPKAIGEYCRKVTATNNKLVREGKLPCTVIFINQVREKIGCFHYNSPVLLSDGTTKKIGEIVNNKLELEVMSYNEITGELEPKKITNWFDNGKIDKPFLSIKADKPFDNGASYLACTDNHKILTPNGYIKAEDLRVGDKIIQKVPCYDFNEIQEQILIGSMLGDGAISKKGDSYRFRLTHCEEQEAYFRFKTSFFEGKSYKRDKDNALLFDSKSSYIFKKYRDDWYCNDTKKHIIPKDLKLSPLTLAIWFMDDGSFNNESKKSIEIYTNTFNEESVSFLVKKLREEYLVDCSYRVKNDHYIITFSRAGTKSFLDIISPYVVPSMTYKLGDYIQSQSFLNNIKPQKSKFKYVTREATILEIRDKAKDRHTHKFDIEVEDNHNYVISNIVVHNSYGNPLYTVGGKAIPFYVSVDIFLRKGDWIVEGKGESKSIVGQVVKFKTEKNKTYKQQQTGEFDFYFDETANGHKMAEIDNFKEIVVAGIERGIIERAGSWMKYKGENLAQGADNTVAYLKNNMDIFEKIKGELFNIVAVEAERLTKDGK